MSSATEFDTPTVNQSPLLSNAHDDFPRPQLFPASEIDRPSPLRRPPGPPADYESLPEGWQQSKHYYHYGWPVSVQMMYKVLRQLPFGLPHGPDSYPGSLTFGLRHFLGYDVVRAVLCKPDEFCQREGRLILKDEVGKGYVQFITIGCTYSRRCFWRRPTPEGLRQLIELFGEKPRWMEDGVTKKRFCSWTVI